jgi:tRNA(Arg) A34 adenosine deaminase TadA
MWLMPSVDNGSDNHLSKRDKQMLDRAITVAKQSTVKQKHGAVLYKSGRVLAVGVNSTRNFHNTMEIDRYEYTYHAECAALRGAANQSGTAKDATIYVARVNRQGKPVNSMPCSQCLGTLSSAGIKRIIYTA